VAWFDTAVRINLLGESRFYLPNLTLLVIFGSVLALNFFSSRAWCRYLCPLGGLLGLVSRISLVRRRVEAGGCISCGRCAAVCHTGAVDAAQGFHSNPADCTNCLDCSGVCPTRVISFGAGAPAPVAFQPARRQFIGAAGLAVIGAVAVRFLPSPERKLPRAIRPPGATEESMTGKCIRCGECVRVCPTGAIQPVNSASAWPYTWTPHLELRRGYCDYACNACGQVCPTGAVSNLTLEKKRKEIIGIAVIDEKRCIPFKDKKECIVCEEMCPLAPKAVTLKQGDWPVGRPIVDEKLCNGCGICEHQCPVKGESAIKIYRSLEVAPKPAPEAQNG
jgi:MauM/NapG family ferredoxin protein